MKNVLKGLFKSLSGYKLTYHLFQNLYYVGVIGMNYGNGGNPAKSGERSALKYVKGKLGKANPILFDVGANFGHYTGFLLEEFPEATIHSFEPSKDYFEKLRESVKNPNVHLHNLGLGNKAEKVILYKYQDRPGLASVFSRQLDHYHIRQEGEESIQLVTLDGFCSEAQIHEVDFLKLDIEGNELFALQGAGQLIASGKIRFIQFEFGGGNIDSKTYFRDFWHLLSKRYRIYRILKNGLGEVKQYNEFQELFANMNFLAERKD